MSKARTTTTPPVTTLGLGMEGLRTDQAPPLSIPASFFLVSPLALSLLGGLLAYVGPMATATRTLPFAFALTHLAALGFLGTTMLGALYQMIPVVAGRPVAWVRSAHIVLALWILGVAHLALGFATGLGWPMRAAQGLIALGACVFLGPVGSAVLRAPTRSHTVTGMRIALAGLFGVLAAGLLMAEARVSGRLVFSGASWESWLAVHATLGGIVWIGGLLCSVSWQVVPMFYLAPATPSSSQVATLVSLGVALLGAPVALLAGSHHAMVLLAALPAALAIWVLHPILTLRSLSRRKRKRPDQSLRFLAAGFATGPLVFVLCLAATFADDGRWPVLVGWFGLWGWAGLVLHGMAYRIIPFLVWFHRYSPHVGLVPVPSMRELLPEARLRVALGLHVASLLLGGAGIALSVPLLVRCGGGLLGLTGVTLGTHLLHVLLAPKIDPRPSPAVRLP